MESEGYFMQGRTDKNLAAPLDQPNTNTHQATPSWASMFTGLPRYADQHLEELIEDKDNQGDYISLMGPCTIL